MLFAAVSEARLHDVCGQDPNWSCRVALEQTDSAGFASAAEWLVGKPLSILAIVIAALIVNRLARRALKRGLRGLASGGVKERLGAARRRTPAALLDTQEVSVRATQRIEALATVLRSVVTFVIALVAVLLILGELGFNLAPLLAGAGIVGVALGFGSQTLVKDFLSGFFILVEDQFGVGDIVDLETGVTGVVEAVSLRTTRLRSVDGTVWHMPNGEIRRVGNMSQHWSRALLDVEVAYDTDIPHARRGHQARGGRALARERARARGAGPVGRRGPRHERDQDPPGRQDDAVGAVGGQPDAARAAQGGVRRRADRDPVPAADDLDAPRPRAHRQRRSGS